MFKAISIKREWMNPIIVKDLKFSFTKNVFIFIENLKRSLIGTRES